MNVVFGITGHTGSSVARHLLGAGQPVRAFVRDQAKAAPWADQGVTVVQGDLADGAAVRGVLEGARGAYVLLPPQWGVPDLFEALAPIIENLVQGVEAAQVPRVVVLSSLGVDHETETGPIRSLRPLEAAWAERRGVTFLRAAYFHENLGSSLPPARADGVLPVFVDPTTARPMVATDDIGQEATRQLGQSPDDASRIVQLTGPTEVSFADIAGWLSVRLGRTVTASQLPPDAVTGVLEAQGAGHYATLYAELNRGMEKGKLALRTDLPVVRGATGVETTLSRLLGDG